MDDETYESAELAFQSLRPSDRVSKPLVAQKCRRIAKVYYQNVGPVGPVRGAKRLLWHVFQNNHGPGDLFNKPERAVQVDGTDQICIFSDVYHVNEDGLRAFVDKCAEVGLAVRPFVKRYPGLQFEQGYRAPTKSMLAAGYCQLYRGTLVGFIV